MTATIGADTLSFEVFRDSAAGMAPDIFRTQGDGAVDPAALRFLAQLHENALADGWGGLTVEALAFICAGFWAWAQEAAGERTQIRLMPARAADGAPLGRDILEIVTPDKPFVVDSVMGELAEAGVDILALAHPIVPLTPPGRSAPADYSLIQVQMRALEGEARDALIAKVRDTLADVEVVVKDFAAMRLRMDQAISDLEKAPLTISDDERQEAVAFLRWLRTNHFTFIGVRDYEFVTSPEGDVLAEEPELVEGAGRGILRDENRFVLTRRSEPVVLTRQIQEFLREPDPVIVAKATLVSRVHRRTALDYIGVKRYGPGGRVVGEIRFAGLFTAEAYHDQVSEIPLVRRKVGQVLARSGFTPGSHSQKRLRNILENHPRNELFESSEDELLGLGLGLVHVHDRPRTRLFLRADRYDRYISAFVVTPRERFNSRLRAQIGAAIARAYGGTVSAFTPRFNEGPLAQVHFTIHVEPFDHPTPEPAALEAEIVALARTWEDDFADALRDSQDVRLKAAAPRYAQAFSPGYQDVFSAALALEDIAVLEALGAADTAVRASRRPDDAQDILRLRLYQRGGAQPLSHTMPILEAMGLLVLTETGFAVTPRPADEGAEAYWVHEFTARAPAAALRAAEDHVGDVFKAVEAAFQATLEGRNENDGFNRLVLYLGVDWRDVCFLRACARYRQQTGMDPSQAVQEAALTDNASIVRLMLTLKDLRFNPQLGLDKEIRQQRQEALEAQITAAIDQVASLDADRALRRIARLMLAIQRTNFYQRDENGALRDRIVFKIASRELDDLPEPKPYRELFVWAPHVEGVHIRFGPIARGGLRWSDRRDDYRTEVLGLVKAQQVKNAVIVPAGAKGGFFPKQLPREGGREAIQAEGVRAYRTFIAGLLDVTDNLVNDTVAPPPDVVSWDEEDPYLVVAADKGTATFSDIANEIATSRGFWLADAFASGGSAGYDHKKMGITARGAWESVKRHFRELGKDIQKQPFTVIGVGDMSGDVFGNGMLLSKTIQLLAAFDHRDIFIDPNPVDPERCWEERRRLFAMGRSTWRDYDQSLISEGGGVFSRSAKAIPISGAMRAWLGVDAPTLPPTALIRAIMKAKAELLWFGGIGTYIKASHEQNYAVGDRANDALRVDAEDVRVNVLGEGANLGLTQAARVALARRGVRLNADFIDNSAGVDSSDHEVNIKILLNKVMGEHRLDLEARNRLLAEMTQDVAAHVLDHNYDQTLAISLAEDSAVADLDAHERLIERLEARGAMNRELEGLPSAEQFRELKTQGLGLTRPEISVLMAYAKNGLYERVLASTVPDDPHFHTTLLGYFPRALRAQYQADIAQHPLRRELIATILSNRIVNTGGATFAHRAREATGGDTDAVARGFAAAQAIFGFQDLIEQIHRLDETGPAAAVQIALYRELILLVRRQTYWLVRRRGGSDTQAPMPLQEVIDAYKPGLDQLRAMADEVISPYARQRAEERRAELVAAGAPEALVTAVVRLRPLMSSSDVIDLARRLDAPLAPIAYGYHSLGDRLRFDELRGVLGGLRLGEHWDRLAVRRLIDDLYLEHQRVAFAALQDAAGAPAQGEEARAWAQDRLDGFFERNAYAAQTLEERYGELESGGAWSSSKVIIALANLREFTIAAR